MEITIEVAPGVLKQRYGVAQGEEVEMKSRGSRLYALYALCSSKRFAQFQLFYGDIFMSE